MKLYYTCRICSTQKKTRLQEEFAEKICPKCTDWRFLFFMRNIKNNERTEELINLHQETQEN